MLGKAVVQDAAHAAGRKRQNLILQELFEIDGLAAVLIRDDDDVVLADDPFADIRMLDVSRYEGEVAAVTPFPPARWDRRWDRFQSEPRPWGACRCSL